MFNLLIGGAAGQGIDTTSGVFERFLKEYGYNVFATRDLMSRVRGGYNFTSLRIGKRRIQTHDYEVDGVLALNQDAVHLHLNDLREDGFVIADEKYASDDKRVISLPMDTIAKEIGNPKVASSVALGALIRLFGFPKELIPEYFALAMKPKILDANVEAAQRGYDLVDDNQGEYARKAVASTGRGLESLDSYTKEDGNNDYKNWIVLNGNEAIGLGALSAGLNFYAAYPMSPSTSVMEYLASVQDEANIVVEQAEDELSAMNMAVGASYAGGVAMTGTSGGGYHLKLEALAMAGMMEVPVVVVDAMRPGPVTGLPTRTEQADLNMAIFGGNGDYPKMVIAIKNHEDAFYQTARAHHLAQKYQLPVTLLTDQYLADGTATVPPFDFDRWGKVTVGSTPEEALSYREGYEKSDAVKSGESKETELAESEYKRYRNTESGISPRLIPGNPYAFVSADTDEHDEYGFITEESDVRIQQVDKRTRKLQTLLNTDIQEPELYGAEDAEVTLLAWGSTEGSVKEAIDFLGLVNGKKINALIFGDVWPLPRKELEKLAAKENHRFINVEQNQDSQLAYLIRRETGISVEASIIKYDGRQISSSEIVDRLTEILG